MEEEYSRLKNKLEEYNQEHLVNFYSTLEEDKKQKLHNQINNIDFEQITNLYKKTKEKIEFGDAKIEPIDCVEKDKINKVEFKEYDKLGSDIIKTGKLAVVTMAGGQGTRLGHKGPKGTFDLGLDSHKSIFEILCDTLKEAKDRYGVYVPWYIMTSEENNKQTTDFFENNNYFGYDKEKIIFFKQGQLPMCNEEGKIILDENGLIKEAADGHGRSI